MNVKKFNNVGHHSPVVSWAIQHVQDPGRINAENSSLAFSNFLGEDQTGRLSRFKIQNNISGVLANGKTFTTISPNYPELDGKLSSNNTEHRHNSRKIKCLHY